MANDDKNKSMTGPSTPNRSFQGDRKDDVNKDEIVDDILANNPLSSQSRKDEEEEVRTFKKKEVIESTEFSWLRLDEYLKYKYKDVPVLIRLIVECMIVFVLLMTFPIATVILKHKTKALSVFISAISTTKTTTVTDKFVRSYLFFTSIYIINAIISLFSDNILYVSLYFLDLIRVPINELIIQVLQVVRSTNYYWSNSLTLILIYISYDYIFGISNETSTYQKVLIFVLWLGYTMGILFIEKFFMNFCTAEIRRRDYRGRIWDINYKVFIYKKLFAISKANENDRKKLGNEINNEFDPGFYIKHNDLKFNTKKDAEDIVESIFAYLGVQTLSYKNLQIYFPDNHKEIYEYLANKKMNEKDRYDPIKYDTVKDEAVKLLTERNDMIKTLTDRESIFNRLDLILSSGAIYVSLILGAFLLGIDYKVYLASIGPAFLTFGWVFSDTIKEIYNCFIFLLVKHPYDVGDRVVIDDKEYVVARTDVLSSTFTDCNGKLVYMPTPVLFGKSICNIRRSRKQSELLVLLVEKTTTFDQATRLRDKLSSKLSDKQDFFTGTVTIRNFETQGDNVAISMFIQHTSNFQQVKEKLKRREVCTSIVQSCLEQTGIGYTNSFKYVD